MNTSALILTAVCLLLGSYLLIRNARLLLNQERLIDYLQTSAKGRAWIARFGMQKTLILSRRYFVPAGCLLALALLAVGLRNLLLIGA